MNRNEELIQSFYTALQGADIEGVRACYSPDVVFSDPVFRELRGDRALLMWEMFFQRKDPIRVTFDKIQADEVSGSGQWTADYDINGRHVRNQISSRFVFANGQIVEHHDDFDVHRWAAQALGRVGRLTGWAPPMRNAMHKRSARLLDSFQRSKATG